MSAINKGCAVLVAGVCVSLAGSGGPARVIVCSPTPVPRVDSPPGTALNITADQYQNHDPAYAGDTPANFYDGTANGKFIGASCDPPAAYPTFRLVTDAGGKPVLVTGTGDRNDPGNGRIYPLYQPSS